MNLGDIEKNMKFIMKAYTSIFLVLVLTLLSSFAERKPNVVFFFIDDMGFADPSCFGNPHVKTPHIDQMASDGIKLTNFYVNSPICSASRVAVTTGHYPGRWKIHSYLQMRKANEARGMNHFLKPEAPTTVRAMKEAGYATAHFGKWHMGGGRDVHDAPRPQAYGFDESLVCFEGMGDKVLFNKNAKSGTFEDVHGPYTVTALPKHKLTETYVDRGIDFIKRNKDKPFYLRIFPNDVHDAHVPVPGTDDKWKGVTENHYDQKFFAVLEEMDRQLGRVVDTIDSLGLAKHTLIVFTSDNGPTDWPKYYGQGFDPPGFTGPYFGRKWSLFEGGIRMPFIARWKGTIPSGVEDNTSVVAAIDLSPTFRALCGVAEHPSPDGHDRSNVLLGKASKRPSPVFWQYGAPHANLKPGKREFVSPTFAMRTEHHKLLVNRDGTGARVYDLSTDPGEKNNLLETHPALAKKMWTGLQAWAKGLDYEIGGELSKPEPLPIVQRVTWTMNKDQEKTLQAHEIIIQGNSWYLNGKNSWLALSKKQVPRVAGRGINLHAAIDLKPGEKDGVIFAHGGDRTGYALYVSDRKPVFVITENWKRTILMGKEGLASGERWRLDGRLDRDGQMTLRVNGEVVDKGKSRLLSSEPGDAIEIGADLVQPVGAYEVPNYYDGAIFHLRLNTL